MAQTQTTHSYTDDSDQSLMSAYGQGDARAFEELYRRHKDPLYRYLFRQLANEAVVNELFQEIWSSVIKARSRYQATARFTTWLYRIAHNQLMDYYRAQGRLREWQEETQEEAAAESSVGLQAPEDFVSQSELAQRLKELIAALPPPQRDAFLLKEESGLTLEQIAQISGVERETIKSRLRYATDKLRQGLHALYHETETAR